MVWYGIFRADGTSNPSQEKKYSQLDNLVWYVYAVYASVPYPVQSRVPFNFPNPSITVIQLQYQYELKNVGHKNSPKV